MPKLVSVQTTKMTPKEKILFYCLHDPKTDCWNWTAYKDRHGYGKTNVNGYPEMAHRASWLAHFGEIPDAMFVCHMCDNRLCVNPAHLFLGTPKENSDDMRAKGRHKITFGSGHGSAKINEKDVLDILRLVKLGQVQRAIADQYGVTPMVISNIVTGKRWKHVPREQRNES